MDRAAPRECPSCHAPLQPGAPFCGQCGFDLPQDADSFAEASEPSEALGERRREPGAKPRPEKCPFCSKLVEGEELACRQCGFDLDREWQPVDGEPDASEPGAVFDPKMITCRDCGQVNPDSSSFCSKCNAPISNTVPLDTGTKSVWFDGYLTRRMIDSVNTLPTYARITCKVLGVVSIIFAVEVSVSAVFKVNNLFDGLTAAYTVFLMALLGTVGYLTVFGRPSRRRPSDEGEPPDKVAPPPDNG